MWYVEAKFVNGTQTQRWEMLTAEQASEVYNQYQEGGAWYVRKGEMEVA